MSIISQEPYVTKPFTASSGYGVLSRTGTGVILLPFPSFYNSDFASISAGVINFSKSGKYLIEFSAKIVISANLNSSGSSYSRFVIKKNTADIGFIGGTWTVSPVVITNLNFQASPYWLDTTARTNAGTASGVVYNVDSKFSYNSQITISSGETISISLEQVNPTANTTTVTYRDLDLRITEMAN